MTELWLVHKDAEGKDRRVEVTGEQFVVGRHSQCDHSIPDGRLSREHIRIDRVADIFVVSDLGSSNGTRLNDEELKEPKAVKNGDVLDLGGVLVTAEIESDQPAEPPPADQNADASGQSSAVAQAGSAGAKPPAVKRRSSFPPALLLMVPLFGLIILVFAGVIIYLAATKGGGGSGSKGVAQLSKDDDLDEDLDPKPKKPTPRPGTLNPGQPSNPMPKNPGDSSGGTGILKPKEPTVTDKVEQNGALFLRRIAQNDPKAFLTTEQAQRVNTRAKQLGGSAALVDNINSVRKNAAQIRALAEGSNLKPQFLAVAVLTRLGSNRGDVLATARSMIEVFDKLTPQIGDERADDALLMVAAFDQGAAGETMKMRNMLQDLATKSTESPRTIRTIWYLEKENKITKSEFDRALSFLAIGTITQDPKEFGVKAEALIL
jgi:hypothetical protein